MNLQKSRQAGASLLEALGFLAIGGFVIAGAAGLLTGAFSGQKSNSVMSDMNAVALAVKKMHSTASSYGTVSLNAALITQGNLPKSLRTTAPSTINNQWGGAVVVTGATSQFTISSAGIPQDICAQTLATLSGGDWEGITVNGTALGLPATAAAAAAACGAATNTVILTTS